MHTKRKIIFINEPTMTSSAGVSYYNDANTYYKNMLSEKGFDVEIKSLLYDIDEIHIDDPKKKGGVGENGTWWIINSIKFDKMVKDDNSNNLYIFNPVNYCTFIGNIVDNLMKNSKKKICDFLLNINYVMLSHELFKDDLSIIGYKDKYHDIEFSSFFFNNSEINCVNNGISILEKHGIYNNEYFVLNHCNLLKEKYPAKEIKEIDVLFYGNISENLTPYRTKIINLLKQLNDEKFGFNIVIKSDIFNNELDEHLRNTKIVIHIPSHMETNLVPFAKITNLQKKGIFFITEEIDDENMKDAHNYICTYKKNDVNDLYDKISFYLDDNNKNKIDEYIKKGYAFIEKHNFDLCKIIESINYKRQKICFLNNNHDFFEKWTSVKFYVTMTNMIKKLLLKNNKKPILINDFESVDDNILFIDISVILFIYLHPSNFSLNNLLKTKYILIIGENVDEKYNTFMGWNSKILEKLNFSQSSILYKIIKNSYRVTYQNNKLFELLKNIKNDIVVQANDILCNIINKNFRNICKNNALLSSLQRVKNHNDIRFFPIDCFSPEHLIGNSTYCDIDVLYYGATAYDRRQKILSNMMNSHLFNIVIVNNVFDLNVLINRSKIILHINSVENCIHIPYAKIGKLLSNNKIVMIEETDELKKSDLLQFVHTFKISDNDLLERIHNILKNYNSIQEKLNEKNPCKFLEKNYNFEKNTMALLD